MNEEVVEQKKQTRKDRVANRLALFSLTSYLQRKAIKRLAKANFREEKRQAKQAALLGEAASELIVSDTDTEEHVHEHGGHCNHDHG